MSEATDTIVEDPIPEEVKPTPEPPTAEDVIAESFIQIIRRRIRGGLRRAKEFFFRTGKRTKSATVHGTKTGWKWTKKTGRFAGLGATGVLHIAGRVLFTVVRFVGKGFIFAIGGIVFVVGAIAAGAITVIVYALYLVIRLAQLIALMLSSPWIAMHSRAALREDWQIMWFGMHPKYWPVVHPSELAEIMNSQQKRTAAHGQSPRTSGESAGKGRATPGRRARRSPKQVPVPHGVVTATP